MAFFKGVETAKAKTKGRRKTRKSERMTKLSQVRAAAARARGKQR